MELSYQGTFVPRNESSMGGTFVPGNESSLVRKFHNSETSRRVLIVVQLRLTGFKKRRTVFDVYHDMCCIVGLTTCSVCSFCSIYYTGDYVSTFDAKGHKILSVDPRGLTMLAEQAFVDVAHLLRPSHLQVKTFKILIK